MYCFSGNALASAINQSFSTYDNDHDGDDFNCAKQLQGGWWFNRCDTDVESHLNGDYDDMRWSTAIGWNTIVRSEMKIVRCTGDISKDGKDFC